MVNEKLFKNKQDFIGLNREDLHKNNQDVVFKYHTFSRDSENVAWKKDDSISTFYDYKLAIDTETEKFELESIKLVRYKKTTETDMLDKICLSDATGGAEQWVTIKDTPLIITADILNK